MAELLAFMDLDPTPFSKRVFSIFDDDQSGEVDFREFVLSLWNYCSLSHDNLIVFAFDMYDRDSSGFIDCSEIEKLLLDVYGGSFSGNPHAKG